MLVIIIGLPGSGKTEYQKSNYKDYICFDDFIETFCDLQLLNALIHNTIDICINDPRLCDINTFRQYLKIFLKYIRRDDILLVLFDNDLARCIENATTRISTSSNNINKILFSINHLHSKYNIDNYQDYNCKVIPVYNPLKN